MVRFKVIKGSHLLLALSIIILALVIAGIGIKLFLSQNDTAVQTQTNLVQMNQEAETETVFASASIYSKSLDLDPDAGNSMTIEIISDNKQSDTPSPSVLIYHTHTHEAYEQINEDRYVAVEAWRTTDPDHSVVRVGSELASLLQARGFEVVHDTTDHEKDELKTAYTRSLRTLQSYKRTFDLYIDLHRDAYIEGTDQTSSADEKASAAQIMLLIGNGVGFEEKPFYEENLAFAKALTQKINLLNPGLCKDVLVKDGRYNQHIGPTNVLIEVGHNRNTLEEALATLPYLADALEMLMITHTCGEPAQSNSN